MNEEFKRAYKNLLKKYVGLTSLYNFHGKISMEETRYTKRGARWIQTDQHAEVVEPARMLNSSTPSRSSAS